jgi:hypothetical protein
LCIAACALAAPRAASAHPGPRPGSLAPALSLFSQLDPPSGAPLPSWLVAPGDAGRLAMRQSPRSGWIFDLPNLDRAPLDLSMNFDVGTRQNGLRLDGTLRVSADFPAVSGGLHLRLRGHDIPIELPWVQLVPQHTLGLTYLEVRVTLYEHRF